MATSDTVTVKMSPLSILMKWDDVLYIKNTDNRYIKFQWYKNGQEIITYGNAVYYTDPEGLQGTYFVRAYYSDTEYDESCPVVFTTKTRSSIVSLYPNPVERYRQITIESDEAGHSFVGASIQIYDISGRKIHSSRSVSQKTMITLNAPAGNYIVHITIPGGKEIIKKLIIK